MKTAPFAKTALIITGIKKMWILRYKEGYDENEHLKFIGAFDEWEKAAKVASALNVDNPITEEVGINPYVLDINNGYFPFVVDVRKNKAMEYNIVARTPDNMHNKATHQIYCKGKPDEVLRICCIAQSQAEAAKIVAKVINDIGWKL